MCELGLIHLQNSLKEVFDTDSTEKQKQNTAVTDAYYMSQQKSSTQ